MKTFRSTFIFLALLGLVSLISKKTSAEEPAREYLTGQGSPALYKSASPWPSRASQTTAFANSPKQVAGNVVGGDIALLECTNISTGQALMVEMETPGEWNCAAQGLIVSPGDTIKATLFINTPVNF